MTREPLVHFVPFFMPWIDRKEGRTQSSRSPCASSEVPPEIERVHSLLSPSVDDSKLCAAVRLPWTHDFIREAHTAVHESFKKMCGKKRASHYANQVSLTQGSGTGKSRMMREVQNSFFGIPINLRKDEEQGTNGLFANCCVREVHLSFRGIPYPPADKTLRKMFLRKMDSGDDLGLYFQYCFGMLFRLVATELEIAKTESGEKLTDVHKGQALAAAWQSHLERNNNRERLYNSVSQTVVSAASASARANPQQCLGGRMLEMELFGGL